MKDKKYTAEEIREAVDIATGDDGFRSKEVISILETNVKQNTEEYKKQGWEDNIYYGQKNYRDV